MQCNIRCFDLRSTCVNKHDGLHGVTYATGFVRVEPVEMTGDDWYRDGERQHAGNGAR